MCGWDRTARRRIIGDSLKRVEEKSLMNSVIEATTDNGSFAALGGDERRKLLLLLAAQGAQEDAAINAEAILTQAEEALVLG